MIDNGIASALAAVDYTIAQDGGTFRIGASGRLIEHSPTDGYAVGIYTGTFQTVALGSPWTRDDAAAAILAARDYALTVNERRNYALPRDVIAHVGTWIDAGVIHVDPVVIVNSHYKAALLARMYHQRAIWSFADGAEITL